jgi:hypothetical protein
MQKWKDALFEAANLSDFHFNKGRYGMGLVLILNTVLKIICIVFLGKTTI